MHVMLLTTAHLINDVRIAVKEAAAIVSAGSAEVTLLVADGKGSVGAAGDRFRIRDLGLIPQGRFRRVLDGWMRAYNAIRRMRPNLVHYHDLELLRQVTSAVDVPVIALGGAGTLAHLRDAVESGASAVAAASLFVYHRPRRAVLITYPSVESLENLFGAAR